MDFFLGHNSQSFQLKAVSLFDRRFHLFRKPITNARLMVPIGYKYVAKNHKPGVGSEPGPQIVVFGRLELGTIRLPKGSSHQYRGVDDTVSKEQGWTNINRPETTELLPEFRVAAKN